MGNKASQEPRPYTLVSPRGRSAMVTRQDSDIHRHQSSHSASVSSRMSSSSDFGAARLFVALYDFSARTENELSFSRGDEMHVLSKEEENWWEAKLVKSGETGWVPSNFVAPHESVKQHKWYHGRISRSTAEYLLGNGVDGSFLVRESESKPGEHSISLRYDGMIFHYRVSKGPSGLFVAEICSFPTIPDLIRHHAEHADGLMCPLTHPVIKQKAQVYGVSKQDDIWEVDRSEIVLGEKLGVGHYGEVFEGTWTKFKRKVAVKTLKQETMDSRDFIKEANVMKYLRHPNLVQLLGVCSHDGPVFIITEFVPHGNLLDYLRSDEATENLDAGAMLYCASQIASGMSYLEESQLIHRDLAARNCLVGDDLLIKLADFGLARFMNSGVYHAKAGTKFPIKWTAPEALTMNTFTIKSDVWAFGVTLWEIATFGDVPYEGIDLFDVLDKIQSGYRMPRPEGCPSSAYKLMIQCWDINPDLRPSFDVIKSILESMYSSDMSLQEQVDKTLTLEKGMSLSSDLSESGLAAALAQDSSDSEAEEHHTTHSNQPAQDPQDAATPVSADSRSEASSGHSVKSKAQSEANASVGALSQITGLSSLSSTKEEVEVVIRKLFKQIAVVLKEPQAEDYRYRIELVIVDAQQIVRIAQANAHEAVKAAGGILSSEIERVAEVAHECLGRRFSSEHKSFVHRQLKKVAAAAKHVYDKTKEAERGKLK